MTKIMELVVGLLAAALWVLGLGLYILTLYFAYRTGFVPMLLTLIFPVAGQFVWLWVVWDTTGQFFNYYTILCLSWVFMALVIFGTAATAHRRRSA